MIIPKNWDTFQHYRDRRPAWIKLHKLLLDDYVFQCLPVGSRALAPMLWLLASEYEDGEITASLDEIAFRMRMNVEALEADLRPLIVKEFFETDIERIKMLATPEPKSSPEREGEGETELQVKTEGDRPATPASTTKSNSKAKQQKLPLEPPKRATRLANDWKPSTNNTDHARQEGLTEVQMAQQAVAFRNYWVAKGGKDAAKMDWDATWHNWVIRFATDKGLTPRPDLKAPEPSDVKLTDDEWKLVLRHYATTSNWNAVYGPPPGAKGCRVPRNLLPDDLEET